MEEACLSSICSDQLDAEDLDLEKSGTTLLFVLLWFITYNDFQKHDSKHWVWQQNVT
jgi:hypothetical protein